ncbi:MAG: ECF transporter S component [Candidatus Improbicoccus devescovinae]|nr:MAG: ECF transporter S component [Candidatus Improbicoccus devescovinae]
MNKNINFKLKFLSIISFLTTISLIFSNFNIFLPVFPYLKLEFSESLIYTITLLFGIKFGLISFFAMNFIKTFFFSFLGWPGFLIRISSIIVIFFLGKFNKKKFFFYYILTGIMLNIIIKILISIIFWLYLYNIPNQVVKIIIPISIIFNIFKMILNYILAKKIINFIFKIQKIYKITLTE